MIRFSTIFETVSYLSLPQNGYQKSTLAGEDPKIFASAERGGAVWPGPGGFRKRNPEGSSLGPEGPPKILILSVWT